MKKYALILMLFCFSFAILPQAPARTFFGKISQFTYNIKNNNQQFLTGDEDYYIMVQKGKWWVSHSAKIKDGDVRYNLYVQFLAQNTSFRDIKCPVEIIGYDRRNSKIFSQKASTGSQKAISATGRETTEQRLRPIEIPSAAARDLHNIEVKLYPHF